MSWQSRSIASGLPSSCGVRCYQLDLCLMRLSVTLVTFARGIIQAFFNLLLCVAPTAVAFATPAFAQYAPQDYQTAAPPSGQHKSAAPQNGLHAFAMVPRGSAGSTLDDPSFTGGGSTGYNQLNRSY